MLVPTSARPNQATKNAGTIDKSFALAKWNRPAANRITQRFTASMAIWNGWATGEPISPISLTASDT